MAETHVTYRFEASGLPGTRFTVTDTRAVEALNEPYRFEVGFSIEDADADLAELLGRDCVLTIERADKIRRFCGLVRHVEEGHRWEGRDDYAAGAVVVVPALWTLSLTRNTKIFQEMSVPDILEAVLGEKLGPYKRAIQLDLGETYPRREYCVQYQESDLDFVHRLMEEEGISYAFDHEGEQELMVLRDANSAFADLVTGAGVPFHPSNAEIIGPEPVNHFLRRQTTQTTSVVIGDWDWTRAQMPFSEEQRAEDPLGRDREHYEHSEGRNLALWDYNAGVRAYQAEDSARQVRVRHESLNRDTIICEGIGRVTGFAPGAIFELTGHSAIGVDGRYLLLRVEHVSKSVSHAIDGFGAGDAYFNRFECIPVDTSYRPKRVAQKPNIAGIQTAVVTGPSGQEIHTDEYGRIKVQFHWDRDGQMDENTTCWIRVQQPWAGAGWGLWYLPRIGMEVIVHFVDGDPDRPLVTGCVYNGTNLPPYPLPDEKTKSTIKSNSSLGGGGFNEFRFEDKAGSEEIYTHAQKDYNEVVENDHNTLVHHDQTNTVDNDQLQIVHANQVEQVDANQQLTVDGNRTLHIKTNYDETVDGTETRHVIGDVTESFDANETRDVTGNLTESISGDETRTIGGDLTETILGGLTQDVTGSSTIDVTGSIAQTITGGVTVETPATYDVTATGGYTVVAAGGITLNAAAGIQIGAPGGLNVVDAFFDWVGVNKSDAGSASHGYVYLKDEFNGMTYAAIGVKVGLTSLDFSATVSQVENEGFALGVFLNDLRVGALEVFSGFSSK